MLLFTLTSLSAQTDYYTCYSTELYSRLDVNKNWDLISTNKDSNIPIAVTKNVIQINAKSATTFKINSTNYKDFDNESLSGRRYSAYEVVNQKDCYIDLVRYKEKDILLLSVVYFNEGTQFNLRYYIYKSE